MNQTINDKLDDLQNRISALKESVEKTRVSKAQADAQNQVAATARQASGGTSNSWNAVKQEVDAEFAEADAAEALAFAEWAIGNAGVTVLDEDVDER